MKNIVLQQKAERDMLASKDYQTRKETANSGVKVANKNERQSHVFAALGGGRRSRTDDPLLAKQML